MIYIYRFDEGQYNRQNLNEIFLHGPTIKMYQSAKPLPQMNNSQ